MVSLTFSATDGYNAANPLRSTRNTPAQPLAPLPPLFCRPTLPATGLCPGASRKLSEAPAPCCKLEPPQGARMATGDRGRGAPSYREIGHPSDVERHHARRLCIRGNLVSPFVRVHCVGITTGSNAGQGVTW